MPLVLGKRLETSTALRSSSSGGGSVPTTRLASGGPPSRICASMPSSYVVGQISVNSGPGTRTLVTVISRSSSYSCGSKTGGRPGPACPAASSAAVETLTSPTA